MIIKSELNYTVDTTKPFYESDKTKVGDHKYVFTESVTLTGCIKVWKENPEPIAYSGNFKQDAPGNSGA